MSGRAKQLGFNYNNITIFSFKLGLQVLIPSHEFDFEKVQEGSFNRPSVLLRISCFINFMPKKNWRQNPTESDPLTVGFG